MLTRISYEYEFKTNTHHTTKILILGIVLDIMLMMRFLFLGWTTGPNMTGKYDMFNVKSIFLKKV